MIEDEVPKGELLEYEYRKYNGLIVLLLIATFILNWGDLVSLNVIETFIGLVFLVMGLAKFIEYEFIAEKLAKYDVLAKRFTVYGYMIPFIELYLGFAFILNHWPDFRNILAIVYVLISTYSVKKVMNKRNKIRCVCFGNFVNHPITKRSYYEDLLMLAMVTVVGIINLL